MAASRFAGAARRADRRISLSSSFSSSVLRLGIAASRPEASSFQLQSPSWSVVRIGFRPCPYDSTSSCPEQPAANTRIFDVLSLTVELLDFAVEWQPALEGEKEGFFVGQS
ncbi:hypothetical protein LZ30DRAFT_684170 [Colletotrichum cereale]|nr:hypothetical protein LZ30DRAFT_684170 [Colletotrichum cereale]